VRVDDDEMPDEFSGWALSREVDHEHGENRVVPLLSIAATKPGLVQLLALPHGLSALVRYRPKADLPAGKLRIEPHVFRAGEELTPKTGSYLHSLQTP
jgi:hypothetical protein